MVMEGKKSYDMLSVRWRHRKVWGIVLVHVQRPGSQGNQWCNSKSKSKGLRNGGQSTDVTCSGTSSKPEN